MNSSKKIQFKTQKQKAKKLIAAGDFGAASVILRRLIDIDRKDVEVLTGLADCLSAADQKDDALIFLNRAQELNQKDILALLFKCDILLDMGRYQEGIKLLENEIQNGLNDCEAYAILGNLYQGAGDYNSAVDVYKKALGFSKIIDSRVIENNLANAYTALGQFSDAIKIHDKLINDNPNDIIALINKAATYEQMGDSVKSLNLLKQAVEDNPNSSIALDKLAYLYDIIDAHDEAENCRVKAEDIKSKE